MGELGEHTTLYSEGTYRSRYLVGDFAEWADRCTGDEITINRNPTVLFLEEPETPLVENL